MKTTLLCIKCKQNLPLKEFYYNKLRKRYTQSCKKCNTYICRNYQSEKRKAGDINFLLRSRAAHIKRDCKTRKRGTIEVAPNLPDLMLKQYAKQNGLCFYTGEPMTLTGYAHDDNFATVDRIDSTKGYVDGNIVFCLSIVNKMKQNMSLAQFKLRCQQILKLVGGEGFEPPVKEL